MHLLTAVLSFISFGLCLAIPLESSDATMIFGGYSFTPFNTTTDPTPIDSRQGPVWQVEQFNGLNCQGNPMTIFTAGFAPSPCTNYNGPLLSFTWNSAGVYVLTDFAQQFCGGNSLQTFGNIGSGCFSLLPGGVEAQSFIVGG
jgi:hypothetical protein